MSSTDAQVKAEAPTTATTATPPTSLPAFDLKSIEGKIASIQQQLPTIEQQINGLSQFLAIVSGGKLPALALPITSGTPIALPSVTDAVTPTTALTSKAGLGAGVIGVIGSLIASQAGVIGMPVGEAATTTGAVLPLLSAGVGVLGAAGKLAPLLRGLMLVL